ncbi:MAG TPA: DUF58 domain-containing protein [Syntrophorhabdales bacterium]|nr:DUF58 domain-containing protein [Syntrophorhabdales bacterium]
MDTVDRRVPSLFIIPLVLGFVGVLLFIALLYGQRDLITVSLMLFGVVVGAKLWSRWSLACIECRGSVDKHRTFPGEKLFLRATVENRKFLPVWLQVKVPITGFAHDISAESVTGTTVGEASLLWYENARFQWDLMARSRGVYHIGPLGLVSGDLFGFFLKGKETTETIEVIVYPRLVPLRSLALPKRDFFGIPGAESPVQDPIYILGTRDYQQGRPAKYIHWKATARHHRLQEKIFEPTEQEKILLVVDVGQFELHKAEEEFEGALETVASMAVLLDERGCSVGLVTNGAMAGGGPFILPVARHPQQLNAFLEALARMQMKAARDLIDTMRLHLRLPWGISCLHFGLKEDGVSATAREFFAQRGIPSLFFFNRIFSGTGEPGPTHSATVRTLDEIRVREGHG